MGGSKTMSNKKSNPQQPVEHAARLNINSLKSARKEVALKLQQSLAKPVYAAFRDMYVDDPNSFQELMDEIPFWCSEAPDILESEADAIINQVPSLERYLQVIFTTHIMIIAGMKWDEHPTAVDVDVPDVLEFIQLLYSNCAEQFSAHSELLDQPLNNRSVAKTHYLKGLKVVRKQVVETINDLLPTQQTIDKYLSDILSRHEVEADGSPESGDEEGEAVANVPSDEEVDKFTVTAADLPSAPVPPAVATQTKRINISKKAFERGESEPLNEDDELLEGLSDTD